MMRDALPPVDPSDLWHLKPTNAAGWWFVAAATVTTTAGLWLADRQAAASWAAGQILLASAFVQWFVLLHECGHETLFRTRAFHTPLGHVAGFFSLIPFLCWKHIHYRHHKWTGWQDLDPTTVALMPRALGPLERRVVNVCWKYWVPLFSVLYRLNNFWNAPRLLQLFQSQTRARRRLLINLTSLAAIYVVVALAIGPIAFARLIGVAVLLALIIEDVLLLSQHTHMPMEQSRGQSVSPHRAIAQQSFTRSLRLPAWASRLLLHFDAHELHHMYPFVPGYRLREIPYSPGNEVPWWQWVSAARAVPGEVFLFQSRKESGFDV